MLPLAWIPVLSTPFVLAMTMAGGIVTGQSASKPKPPESAAPAAQAAPAGCGGALGKPVAVLGEMSVCSGAAAAGDERTGAPASGASIASLSPGGRAEVAGLQAGDVIYKIDGEDVANGEQAATRLTTKSKSVDITISFSRTGLRYRVRL